MTLAQRMGHGVWPRKGKHKILQTGGAGFGPAHFNSIQ
jgi:hypothetical protein